MTHECAVILEWEKTRGTWVYEHEGWRPWVWLDREDELLLALGRMFCNKAFWPHVFFLLPFFFLGRHSSNAETVSELHWKVWDFILCSKAQKPSQKPSFHRFQILFYHFDQHQIKPWFSNIQDITSNENQDVLKYIQICSKKLMSICISKRKEEKEEKKKLMCSLQVEFSGPQIEPHVFDPWNGSQQL